MSFSRLVSSLAVLIMLAGVTAAGRQRPVAQAYAGFDEATGAATTTYTLFIGPADDAIAWTLSGATSYDPDGDALTYQWSCENRLVLLGVPKDEPNVRARFTPGDHHCTLTVSDGFATDTAAVLLRVKVDAQPPQVNSPDDIVISATEPGGARAGDSSKLANWLGDADATDNNDPHPGALPALISGETVTPETLFALDAPTTVTFRFKDSFDNVGEATAVVKVIDLREGDVFVTTTRVTGFGTNAGVIRRVRDGVAEVYCQSPVNNPNNAAFWGRPSQVIVDSNGRVIFITAVPSGNSNFPHRGLFTCERKGDPGKLLALYRGTGTPREGLPVHMTNFRFGTVNGLHLETVKTTVIDDAQNGGAPRTITQEAYVFSAHSLEDDGSVIESRAFRYLSETGTSEEGPDIVAITSPPPDMTFINGSTYSAGEYMIGRTGHKFELEVSGEVAGIDFGFQFGLGPGLRTIGEPGRSDNFLSDDRNRPDFDSGCKAGNDVSSLMPSPKGGPHGLFSALDNIVWDSRFGGMVLTSAAASYPRYMTAVEEYILDDNPLNDNLNRFTRYELDCKIQQSIGYYQLPERVREAKDLVVGPDGIYGVYSGEEIIRIRPQSSQDDSIYLGHAIGVAVWPPQTSAPSGTALVVRINSPVAVMLTDPSGRRLGVDASGVAVNDFGDTALDSGPETHPRFYLLRNPSSATYDLRSVGTGDGAFSVQVYSTDLSKKRGSVITTSGIATQGALGVHDFTLGDGGAIAFVNSPPVANAGSDWTVDATSPNGARVTLNGTASNDPDGQAMTYRWFGPFGIVEGAVVEVDLPRGEHLLTLQVEDLYGATATDVVAVTVAGAADTTPPVLSALRTMPNAHGWNAGAVTVAFTCVDDQSDTTVTPAKSVTLDQEGAAQSTTASCQDAAGNVATLTIDNVNIDRTPPTVVGALSPQANALGWNNSDVSVVFSCTDHLSGVDASSVPGDHVLTHEGANQSAIGSCVDQAGNQTTTSVTGVNIDKTPPTIVGATDRAANADGWYNAAVSVSFQCNDALSGIAACDWSPRPIANEGVDLARDGSAVDAAGNRATASVFGINIDMTAPSATCSTDATELWPPNRRLVPVTAKLVIGDAGSGAGGLVLTEISRDEGGAEDTPDWNVGTSDVTGFLRATRAGGGDGRVYTLKYLVSDRAGNSSTCSAHVIVPHDRRN